MQKYLLCSLLLFVPLITVHAQVNGDDYSEEKSIVPSQNSEEMGGKIQKEWRKKFINLSFTNAVFSQDGIQDLKSNYGASFTVGRTFFLHKPIGNVLRFGIDATWFDINYTNYQIQHITYWNTENYQYHQGEISMHVGPSITINPTKKLSIHGYFQYCPTFAAIYTGNSNDFFGNYASIWVGGGSLSYGVIGVGMEARYGDITYKPIKASTSENWNTSLNGWRAFITFRF